MKKIAVILFKAGIQKKPHFFGTPLSLLEKNGLALFLDNGKKSREHSYVKKLSFFLDKALKQTTIDPFYQLFFFSEKRQKDCFLKIDKFSPNEVVVVSDCHPSVFEKSMQRDLALKTIKFVSLPCEDFFSPKVSKKRIYERINRLVQEIRDVRTVLLTKEQ